MMIPFGVPCVVKGECLEGGGEEKCKGERRKETEAKASNEWHQTYETRMQITSTLLLFR